MFPVGRVVAPENRHEVWRAVLAQGHEIANHTYSHSWLTNLSDEQVRQEILSWEVAIKKATGRPVNSKFVRPPAMAGFTSKEGDPRLRGVIGEMGMRVALWDVDSGSTRGYDSPRVLEEVASNTQNGSIVLHHFNRADIELLPEIIDNLHGREFELVTLGQLLNLA